MHGAASPPPTRRSAQILSSPPPKHTGTMRRTMTGSSILSAMSPSPSSRRAGDGDDGSTAPSLRTPRLAPRAASPDSTGQAQSLELLTGQSKVRNHGGGLAWGRWRARAGCVPRLDSAACVFKS